MDATRLALMAVALPVPPKAANVSAVSQLRFFQATVSGHSCQTPQYSKANSRIIIGAHHKAGTMATHVFFEHWAMRNGKSWQWFWLQCPASCSNSAAEMCFQHDVHVAQMQTELPRMYSRFVHVVRDPLEMILSAYQYHVLNRQELHWFNTSLENRFNQIPERCYLTRWRTAGVPPSVPYFEFVRAAGRRAGLLQLAQDVLDGFIADMDEVARQTSGCAWVYVLREEDFVTQDPAEVAKLLRFLGDDPAKVTQRAEQHLEWFQSIGMNKIHQIGPHHESPVSEKDELRLIIAQDPIVCARTQASQRVHGYAPMRCLPQ
mmetsp:Transcript_38931/g.64658  ORF Transcript_38931/g.64658 Transcript_38931/m.64658 type:complete len:318 (+) Transcript_38931:57-1010(+)|eukprot:CAMPEP_0119322542 /NCGR_PEP_ID=MMETSP1333-20130426/58488_1 /TAXON_ID=418940 /ORGANISM="Scyphosphaera apsteinii, Strain RCC1455" /LENGTH=317 /DNA_ID=CAMNT_0007329797 /DNA_START=82 /DNA_END=1035 /DNA_ORIENTATION=-